MSIEAMKQALDAMKDTHRFVRHYVVGKETERIATAFEDAMKALRQALVQPEQDEGVDGSVRVFIKRDGEWERVDSYEKALKTLENIYWGKP